MIKRIIYLAAIFTALIVGTVIYSNNIQDNIANGVIRFHILANSDSSRDQDLKIKVRDSILSEFEDELSAAKTREQTIEIINKNIDNIELSAEKTLLKNGSAYPVKAKINKDYFPTKKYGDVTLPAGRYDALRLEIGEAKGHNWWCVMFPPLCYVDVTRCSIPEREKKQLAENMGKEEYSIITGDTTDIKIKFKVVEIWKKIEEGAK